MELRECISRRGVHRLQRIGACAREVRGVALLVVARPPAEVVEVRAPLAGVSLCKLPSHTFVQAKVRCVLQRERNRAGFGRSGLTKTYLGDVSVK